MSGLPINWILARLFHTEKEVRKAYRSFYLNQCLGPVVAFIDDLTNWHIRQSRGRFWGGGMTPDKKSGYDTLYSGAFGVSLWGQPFTINIVMGAYL